MSASIELLTEDELECLALLGRAAGLLRRIIGDGPNSVHDWAEAGQEIHVLQAKVMAQAACRAYPDRFRGLGNSLSA